MLTWQLGQRHCESTSTGLARHMAGKRRCFWLLAWIILAVIHCWLVLYCMMHSTLHDDAGKITCPCMLSASCQHTHLVAAPAQHNTRPVHCTPYHLQEFLMASQPFTRSNSSGFDAVSEAQINVNLQVRFLNRTGLTIQYQVSATGAPLTQLSHTWNRSSAGLSLLSRYQIGNVTLGAAFNQLVNCAVTRGDDPLVVAAKWQHHTVEEFGK